MKSIKDFYNLYPVNKTLRFGLTPVGKTEEFIERSQVLNSDERLASDYQKVKGYIDNYHRQFIKQSLSKPLLKVHSTGNNDSLEDFVECYNNDNTEKRGDNLITIQEKLRNQIVKGFESMPSFSNLDKKELIKNELPSFLADSNEREIAARFKDFTTYFTGFFKNRKNMYSNEAKSTAIAYRLINQNLVKFVDNCTILDKVIPAIGADVLKQLSKDFEPYLNTVEAIDMFKIDNYNDVLSQSQIEVYNSIIGGRIDEGEKVEIKGLNQYINEYNQVHDRKERVPKLKPLFKQILCEREGVSFRQDQFKDAKDVVNAILNAYKILENDVFENLKEILLNINNYNISGIYLSCGQMLTDISQRHYGAWDKITNALVAEYDQVSPRKNNQKQEKRDEQVKKYLKSIKSVSLGKIDYLLKDSTKISIVDYFNTLGAIDNVNLQRENLFALIVNRFNAVKDVFESPTPSEELLRKNIMGIKDLLDAIKDLLHFIKPLCGSGDEQDKEELFYSNFTELYEKLDELITPLYNKVRSYLTKKPYSLDKFKLNFDSPTLLNGWPNPQAYSCSLFRKNENEYYLAILDANSRSCLNTIVSPQSSEDIIEIVRYLQGGDMGKNVQNLLFVDGKVKKVNGRREKTGPFAGKNIRLEDAKNRYLPDDINEIRKKQSFSVNNSSFKREDLNRYINYYIPLVKDYYSDYTFHFNNAQEYRDFSEFTNHINQQAYQLQLIPFSKKHLTSLVDNGQLYLFKITSKDFSHYSKGRPNLHTIYWKMLFDEQNLNDVVYKLNGQAEIFFRKKSSIDNPVIHLANQEISNKSEYNKKHKPTSKFGYDIIKDRRFLRNHYEFHVPITMNFKSQSINGFNRIVLDFIKNKGIKHVIGIDRGERHLLYLTMIDMNGRIKEQLSLNSIATNPNNPNFKQDYNSILAAKEGDRMTARRNWSTIENIKELKQGYLSQIVHQISKMIIENDAILVLENLNIGFMRGRQKVERAVYQKFEKMLIDKLNYIVDKSVEVSKPCGALKALQLTSNYDNFNKSQHGNVRQCGFVFFIPAWNTSKIDPSTGFVNLFDTRLNTITEIKSFFSKFDRIIYRKDIDTFEFAFNYSNFTTKADGTRTNWVVTTTGERIYTHRSKENYSQFVSEIVRPTLMFKSIFTSQGINFEGNIKEAISAIDKLEILKQLLHAFKLTLQMRNSETGTEIDYLKSPVVDSDGNSFDSRNCDKTMPKNADANGAYNIARKGLMIVRQIEDAKDISNIKYQVSNKDWLTFAQK